MNVTETDRLRLRWLTPEDAPFIFELVNDPGWLQYIGDRGVRTFDDARRYILDGPVSMYQRFGFGLYLVELKEGRVPIGICGLMKRDTLDDVDIGFAFLPAYRANGYALEAAAASMAYAKEALGIPRIVAITTPDNDRSARLLEKLGLRFQRLMKLTPEAEEVRLFGE